MQQPVPAVCYLSDLLRVKQTLTVIAVRVKHSHIHKQNSFVYTCSIKRKSSVYATYLISFVNKSKK